MGNVSSFSKIPMEPRLARIFHTREEKSKETQVYCMGSVDISKIPGNCHSLYMISSNFIRDDDLNRKEVEEIKNDDNNEMTLYMIGIANSHLNTNFSDSVTNLANKFSLKHIFFYDYELNANILLKTIQVVSKDLRSLQITSCPLDRDCFDCFQQIQAFPMLNYLCLSYVEPEEQYPFHESTEQKSNRLEFLLNLKNLKTLDFSGNRLTSNDKQFLLQVSTLENLILENMKTDVLDIFYRVAEKFKMLNTLSLADNDMSAFTPVNEQYRFIFPSKLININLSNCKLTDAQVKQIFSKRKNCETLRGIGLRGNGLQDQSAIQPLIDEVKNGPVDISQNAFSSGDIDSFKKNIDRKMGLDYSFQNSQGLNTIVRHSPGEDIKEETRENLLKKISENYQIIEHSTFLKELNVEEVSELAKMVAISMRYSAIFDMRAKENSYYFFFDYNSALYPYSLDHLPTFLGEYQAPINDEIGLYSTPLIQLFKQRSSNLDNSITFREQADLTRSILENLGYYCYTKEVNHENMTEDLYLVLIPHATMTSDYRLITFSIRWYWEAELANVEFNLSEDFFVEKENRVNRIAFQNVDNFVTVMSTLTQGLKTVIFYIVSSESDKDNDEEEVFCNAGFRFNIQNFGYMNIPEMIIKAIDQGFIILQIIQNEDLFDRDILPEDINSYAKQLKTRIKNQIQRYNESLKKV